MIVFSLFNNFFAVYDISISAHNTVSPLCLTFWVVYAMLLKADHRIAYGLEAMGFYVCERICFFIY